MNDKWCSLRSKRSGWRYKQLNRNTMQLGTTEGLSCVSRGSSPDLTTWFRDLLSRDMCGSDSGWRANDQNCQDDLNKYDAVVSQNFLRGCNVQIVWRKFTFMSAQEDESNAHETWAVLDSYIYRAGLYWWDTLYKHCASRCCCWDAYWNRPPCWLVLVSVQDLMLGWVEMSLV